MNYFTVPALFDLLAFCAMVSLEICSIVLLASTVLLACIILFTNFLCKKYYNLPDDLL